MFARVVDGKVESWGSLPESARRLDTGALIYDLPGAGRKWLRAAGWFPVVETDPPEHDPDRVAVASVELVDGIPTQRWKLRRRTRQEMVEFRRDETRAELSDLAGLRQALTANRQWLDRSTAPTNVQTLAQIDRLTRQVSTLLRLVGAQVHADLLDD
jgi:hypothetical protein